MQEKVKCEVCNKYFSQITLGHLKTHNLTVDEYKEKYNVKSLVSYSVHKRRSESKIGNISGYKSEIDKWIKENQGKHFCHCGCDKEIEIRRYYYNSGIPEYISGHQNIGRPVSDESNDKRKISWTKDKRDAAKNRQKIRLENPEYVEELRQFGIDQFSSSESRKNMSDIKKEYYKDNPDARELHRKLRLKQKLVNRNTSIEIKMQNILSSHGYFFKTHIPICNICIPDIVLPECQIIIQCDGDYWHNYPEGLEKDREQDKILKSNGWRVIRFWEHEINNNTYDCLIKFEAIYNDIEYVSYYRQRTLNEWRD